ncbi:MAG: hypothetical protein HOO86_00025 [Bacteroidales bacterium]|nr:hypothetical protein [Bacteroidales bacterium]
MKNLVIVLFSILILCSFNQQKEEKELKITTSNLIGTFGGDEETENAYFGIYEDSIYYPDLNIWVKYELISDTILTTDRENYIEKLLILKLTTDSLVVNNLNYDVKIHLNRRK